MLLKLKKEAPKRKKLKRKKNSKLLYSNNKGLKAQS